MPPPPTIACATSWTDPVPRPPAAGSARRSPRAAPPRSRTPRLQERRRVGRIERRAAPSPRRRRRAPRTRTTSPMPQVRARAAHRPRTAPDSRPPHRVDHRPRRESRRCTGPQVVDRQPLLSREPSDAARGRETADADSPVVAGRSAPSRRARPAAAATSDPPRARHPLGTAVDRLIDHLDRVHLATGRSRCRRRWSIVR